MTLTVGCPNGHIYDQYDIYGDWPEGAPYCPMCYEEWYKEKYGKYTSNYENAVKEQESYQEQRNRYENMSPQQKLIWDKLSGSVTSINFNITDLFSW
jgi:hypothetical protein